MPLRTICSKTVKHSETGEITRILFGEAQISSVSESTKQRIVSAFEHSFKNKIRPATTGLNK